MAKINPLNRTLPQRVDPDFLKEIKALAKMRYMKGLAKKEPTFPEMTALLRRTHGWQLSLNDLKSKPKREDI